MIWLILVLLLIVAIIAALLDALELVYNGMLEFFLHSTWGIITLIAGALSLLLFYASGKSYRQVKLNESFLPNPKRIKDREDLAMPTGQHIDTREFDLSKLTMESLVQKMAFEMTRPGPVFFKGWGNRRLELDVQRVNILKNYIESIRSTGDSLMELQSDAVLSFEKIEALTKVKRNELKKKLKQTVYDLDFLKEEHEHKIKMMHLERESMEEDIKLKKAQRQQIETQNVVERLRAEAEYKIGIAKSKKEKQIALILGEAVTYYKDLPKVLQSYVAVQLGSDNSENPNTDMELQEQLKDFIVRKQKAETRKIEYEADEYEEQTKTSKAKLERERNRYKKNGNL